MCQFRLAFDSKPDAAIQNLVTDCKFEWSKTDLKELVLEK